MNERQPRASLAKGRGTNSLRLANARKSTAGSHVPDTREESALLRLPAELRNIIWGMVLAPGDSTYTRQLYWYVGHCEQQYMDNVHRLLHVSRQVRLETQALFYAQVTIAGGPANVVKALDTLSGNFTVKLHVIQISTTTSNAIGDSSEHPAAAQSEIDQCREKATKLGFAGDIRVWFYTAAMWAIDRGPQYVSDPMAVEKNAMKEAHSLGFKPVSYI